MGDTTRWSEPDSTAARAPRHADPPTSLRWIVAGTGVVLLLALAAMIVGMPFRVDPIRAVATDFARFETGRLVLTFETSDPQVLEARFAETGLEFGVRVPRLEGSGFRLVGGRVHHAGFQPSALCVYEGEDGSRLVYQTFVGEIGDLVEPDSRIERDSRSIWMYGRGVVHLAAWADEEALCVLVGTLSGETLANLALAPQFRRRGGRAVGPV